MLQSKKNTPLWIALALAVLGFQLATPAARASRLGVPTLRTSLPPLPALNWPLHSDWINVKTNGKPSAFGDGIHDDTAALQAGLNKIALSDFGPKTLFLPAGTYRISRTLILKNTNGPALIGQGRSTRIVWSGPAGQAMLLSNGASYARYIGLIWDGSGTAGMGIDHQPQTLYEEDPRHENESFINFTVAGIRVGFEYKLPTSEMTFRNCSFANCVNGVAFLSWNDYNNNFDGCEFQDNGIAINCSRGNVSIRDCHFERSRTEDILLCSQMHSVRRCTSVGSKQFIYVLFSGDGCEATVEDCHVEGWTGKEGAMTFAMRGPTTIYDCTFTLPPDTKAPIRLTNSVYCKQLALVSNCAAPSSSALYDPGANGQVTEIPAGLRGPNLNNPHQSFFRSTAPPVPTIILDVKRAFGAKGDGVHDDTDAVLNTLAAARSASVKSVVYFPPGNYVITRTLPITGGNYSVEGSGHQTILHWQGPDNGVLWSVRDPQSLALTNMNFTAPLSAAVIRQTSTGAGPSKMLYARLWSEYTYLGPNDSIGWNGHISAAQAYRGLECDSLPPSATVLLDDVTGMIHITNCSRALILGDFLQGAVAVDGAAYEKTGFLGMLAHDACLNTCDIVVRDNQDFVGTNFYTEQTATALRVSGDGAAPGQPGHVTIQGSFTRTYEATPITIDNYEGRVAYTGASIQGAVKPRILQKGARPVDIVLLGNASIGELDFANDIGGQLTLLQNFEFTDPAWNPLSNALSGAGPVDTAALALGTSLSDAPLNAFAGPVVTEPLQLSNAAYNQVSQPLLNPAVAALDDFRLLGAVDLALNYP